MSTLITELSRHLLELNPTGTLVGHFGLVMIVLLVVLLLQKEIVRANNGPRTQQWLSALDVVIVPLVATFGLFLLLHMSSLIRFR